MRYNPKNIEPKWQKIWEETAIYNAEDFSDKPKYVMLTEFPYPSGAGLHMGHMREYTLGDIIARKKRMSGHNVLYPMGYDAFGLPTENYAIKNKIAPQKATADNVANFEEQFKSLGFSFDWSRIINTTDPGYYKWTQWLFLQFFKNDLAYQKEIAINWCPKCKTGLANEEVIDGKHERCGTPVEQKMLKQWLLKITEYADRLIEGLEEVDYSPRIAEQQVNWIGRSVGAEIDFVVVPPEAHRSDERKEELSSGTNGTDEYRDMSNAGSDAAIAESTSGVTGSASEQTGAAMSLRVFTTRPDTLYGATYMVLAPEHPLVSKLTVESEKPKVENYVKEAKAKTDLQRQKDEKEKTGVFTGAYVINPSNQEKIPVWVADYVLMGYGTGAIMAVPAHDKRDYEFARKFDIPVAFVIEPTHGESQGDEGEKKSVYVIVRNPKNNKVIVLDWGPRRERHGGKMLIGGGVEGEESYVEAAEREIAEETGYVNIELVKESEFTGHGYYYSNTKHKNMHSFGKGLLFNLTDEEQTKISLDEGEKDKFKVTWEPDDHVSQMLDDNVHKAFYDYLIHDSPYTGEGTMINSGEFNGMRSEEAREKIVAKLAKEGKATEKVNYKLRDWIFSRQHYWGEPIPIVHCEEHGAVAVPDDQLPVELPPVENYEPTDSGESPLASIDEWVQTNCPTCGKTAKRETDTMPNWAGSSWYYLRYFDPHNNAAFADKKKLDYWGAVDLYLGGMEHTTLHLLYSRFWHQFFYDQGLVPTPEPYAARRGQGIILAEDGSKMSKSLGNVVNPSHVIDSGYGADALRMTIAFLAPYDQTTPWNSDAVAGMYRFLQRLWDFVGEFLLETQKKDASKKNSTTSELETAVMSAVHRAIKKVTGDLRGMQFNTAIAAQMKLSNELRELNKELPFGDAPQTWRFAVEASLKLLAPFAPHFTEELWQQFEHTDSSIHVGGWPDWDEALVKEELVTIVVQINGKVRANITMSADANEEEMVEAAKQDKKIAEYLKSGDLKKTVTVPGKLVNFVIIQNK